MRVLQERLPGDGERTSLLPAGDAAASDSASPLRPFSPGNVAASARRAGSGAWPGPAVAGGPDLHVRALPALAEREQGRVGLARAARAALAFLEPVQRPAVLRMQREVAQVDLLGLVEPALLEEQRAERVRGRLEPAPGL